MRILIADPRLFEVFDKDPDNPEVAVADVLDSRNSRIRLSAIGGSVLDLPVDPMGIPHRVYPRQVVKFNAKGEFIDTPKMARSKITK